ncbi:histidine phosphatase family protein [Saccharibacillus sacchari]|uniref:Histidine phosphatase family protein n=1 Tax=Saccharibacillus sacchari TaxID=456493 RepID=A0ACC6P7C7_9BACL
MTIYLVRHGADDESYRGGWSQRGLNTEGYRQSEKLGEYLKARNSSAFRIGRIVSSDLQRALDTASEISRFLDVPVERDAQWREMNNGIIAGMPNEIVNERFPGLYFSGLRMDERFPGGESPQEFYDRIEASFTGLCEKQLAQKSDRNILIVTHGGVINIVYHLLKGAAWSNQSKSFPSAHTSLHRIEHVDGKWTIALENATQPI